MITLRVEIMTVQRMTEEKIEEPEGWSGMTASQRREWCEEAVSGMRDNLIGMTYEYPEQDDDDRAEYVARESGKEEAEYARIDAARPINPTYIS